MGFIKTFNVDVVVNEKGKKNASIVYIHLFESNIGNRKFVYKCADSSCTTSDCERFFKSQPLYNDRLIRWENGRHDPEILRYNEVAEDDIANALRGEIK